MRLMYTLLLLLTVFAHHAAQAQEEWPNGQQKWPDKITIGLIPVEGKAESLSRMAPLIDHLQKELGIEVVSQSGSDYHSLIAGMARKEIDFAYFGPKSYTDAVELASAEALVLQKGKDGKPGYNGMIIARADAGITSIKDAQGRSFAFTDPNSTSGFLVPNILFSRDLKIKPNDHFSQVKFSGSHAKSVELCFKGDVDLVAVSSIAFARVTQNGEMKPEDFVVLWKSDLIPGSPFAGRKDLPSSLKAAFTGAMLKFNLNESALEQLQISGYQHVHDKEYDIIRYLKLMKKQMDEEAKLDEN